MNLSDLHEALSKEFEALYKEEKATATESVSLKQEASKPRFETFLQKIKNFYFLLKR